MILGKYKLSLFLAWSLFLLTAAALKGQETTEKLTELSFDEILTTPIYDDQFNSINTEAELAIGNFLKGKTLDDLVSSGLINRKDMAGFALPLGVFGNENKVDFRQGLLAMWQAKANWIAGRSNKVDITVMQKALKAIAEYEKTTDLDKLQLTMYRRLIVEPNLLRILEKHDSIAPKYSPQRREFMEIIAKNLSPNVILGYNIQELMPTTHMLADGSIKAINPIFKAYFYDRLWQEAGYSFISNFPARYDFMNSFGPFQLTDIAVQDISKNSRLIDDFKRYKSIEEINSVDDHVWVATAFAYNNWERLSYSLQADSTIQKFIDYFSDWEENIAKKRTLRILIAGVTACMHHNPPQTWIILRDYLKENNNFEDIHYQMIQNSGNAQLLKYYYSSAKAYLIMKVYAVLFD